MYCIARRCVLPSLSPEQRDHLLAEAALQSLAQVLEAVPDPRGTHGLRYDLPFLLTCLIAVLLCNCDGTEAVAQWCQDQVALLRSVFGPRLFLTPSGSLYRWLLPHLDASALERVLGAWVQVTTGEDRSRLRTGNAPQILAAFRNLTITLIHRSGSCQIKATRRHFASCPLEALALLTSSNGGQQ